MAGRGDGFDWRARRDARAAEYRGAGRWRDTTIVSQARDALAAHPDRVALWDAGQAITFRRVVSEANALASALLRAGVAPGEVISYQLPNWYEAAVINLAAAIAGLVVNPLVPIYRDSEVGYMLADSRSRALFVPPRFRSQDYLGMVARLRRDLPDLALVSVVRGEADEAVVPFKYLVRQGSAEPPCEAPDADALKLLLYTSGTTGRAKGVLHTHNTIAAAVTALGEFWSVTRDDVVFMASPVSHITGYLYALEQPFILGTAAVLMETWEPRGAAELIREHGCTIAFGATPFLKELADAVEESGERLPSLRLFPCGGAPVPPELAYRCAEVLEPCTVCRIYGSTETAGPIAFGERNGDRRLAAETDGQIFNAEVRICDPTTGTDVRSGEEGEILVRGPQNFVGYIDPADDAAAFDDAGFFRTGDLGKIHPPGYVVTTGRSKDLIIRGGENISPREIEDRLAEHPAIREVAIVGMPDGRLGEAVCGYVVCNPGQSIDQAEAARFLVERKLAKQKIPVRLEIVDSLPRTTTGKIRKDLLRNRAAGGAGEPE